MPSSPAASSLPSRDKAAAGCRRTVSAMARLTRSAARRLRLRLRSSAVCSKTSALADLCAFGVGGGFRRSPSSEGGGVEGCAADGSSRPSSFEKSASFTVTSSFTVTTASTSKLATQARESKRSVFSRLSRVEVRSLARTSSIFLLASFLKSCWKADRTAVSSLCSSIFFRSHLMEIRSRPTRSYASRASAKRASSRIGDRTSTAAQTRFDTELAGPCRNRAL
mmetsp:Transcript_20129/g.69364  ORF Transcript_20129/g.69364 Transcript_20129/m.69364 type:complete len:223 (-) Transcript_20129:571-1239(-)